MIVAAVSYLCLCLAFAWATPRLAARLHPATGVRLIVPAALGVAGAGVFVLAASALTWAAQRPDIAAVGDWSATRLRAGDPVPRAVAIGSASLLAGSMVSLGLLGIRRARALADVGRAVPAGNAPGNVVVLDDERVEAFATPGRHGRIVVTSGLIGALDPAERAALIAHERSHVRHRHAWWLLAAHAATAVNPLLGWTCHAVEHAVERWADEDAAVEVGDRKLMARTVARVSLLKKRGSQHGSALALGASGGDLPRRVRALLDPRPDRGVLAAVVLVSMLVGVLVATVVMQQRADALFDFAQVR